MKQRLKDFCASIQIDCAGIAPAGPYWDLAKKLEKQKKLGHYSQFAEQNLQKRIDPRQTMPDVQSIIVCLFPYYTGEKAGANLAKYCYALDYHILVRKKLEQIGRYLQEKIANFSYQAYTDTGPLADRYLAYLAGLGFYGINSQLIHQTYGSYVCIGYMLTNYPFEPDKPLTLTCSQCGRCIRSCPGKAILGDFSIVPHRCRSYLTQKKGGLTENEKSIIRTSGLIFGCDICQDVCPHNQNIFCTPITEFQKFLLPRIDCQSLPALSNKEFNRRYGNRAFSWRGKKTLVRNFSCLD
ncbi:MAG: tRNA epoxyqueuosine(34) reductase QueG [Veillonellales bacterium]